MCVYAPNDPRGKAEFFFRLLEIHVFRVTSVLGGEFNCIDNLELDKVGGDSLAGDKGSVEFNGFADSLSIKDIFRVKFQETNVQQA